MGVQWRVILAPKNVLALARLTEPVSMSIQNVHVLICFASYRVPGKPKVPNLSMGPNWVSQDLQNDQKNDQFICTSWGFQFRLSKTETWPLHATPIIASTASTFSVAFLLATGEIHSPAIFVGLTNSIPIVNECKWSNSNGYFPMCRQKMTKVCA